MTISKHCMASERKPILEICWEFTGERGHRETNCVPWHYHCIYSLSYARSIYSDAAYRLFSRGKLIPHILLLGASWARYPVQYTSCMRSAFRIVWYRQRWARFSFFWDCLPLILFASPCSQVRSSASVATHLHLHIYHCISFERQAKPYSKDRQCSPFFILHPGGHLEVVEVALDAARAELLGLKMSDT